MIERLRPATIQINDCVNVRTTAGFARNKITSSLDIHFGMLSTTMQQQRRNEHKAILERMMMMMMMMMMMISMMS